ncbi:MAG: aminodeoxychorismate/anthranilate synthase component II [Bdellovibrionales bacterium]|nr:aminodeoxychorismate/anthranilate synthase component II [Bdellovibrionales bacterium]
MERLLLIDNYDSFTYNLAQLFCGLEVQVEVRRADEVDVAQVEEFSPSFLVISPGPKTPAHAGNSCALIKHFAGKIPLFGVCLGLQCMNEVFGGKTVHAPVPVHGKVSEVTHTGHPLFEGVPSPFRAARYHSLMLAGVNELEVTAHTPDEVIMAASHPEYCIHGVQFHPESFLQEYGVQIARNFLVLARQSQIGAA